VITNTFTDRVTFMSCNHTERVKWERVRRDATMYGFGSESQLYNGLKC